MSAAVRAVIFDLGHTVWDFNPSVESWRLKIIAFDQRLARDRAVRTPALDLLERAVAETVRTNYESWRADGDHVQGPSEHLVRDALATLDTTADDETVADLSEILFGEDVEVPVIPSDSVAALGVLAQQGIIMGCVTNTITTQAGIENALRRLGMHHYLRSVVVSTAMGRRKPHPSLFRRALDELGVAAAEAVFVGDRLREDVGGAQAVGMRAVLTRQFRQEELDGATTAPDAVIERLAQLPDVLRRL